MDLAGLEDGELMDIGNVGFPRVETVDVGAVLQNEFVSDPHLLRMVKQGTMLQ